MKKWTKWSESEDGTVYLHFWKAEPACVLVTKTEGEEEYSIQTCCTRFSSLTISGSFDDARLLALTQALKELEESRVALDNARMELITELQVYGLDLPERLKELKSHKD